MKAYPISYQSVLYLINKGVSSFLIKGIYFTIKPYNLEYQRVSLLSQRCINFLIKGYLWHYKGVSTLL